MDDNTNPLRTTPSLPPRSGGVVDVDWLAQQIRAVDGNNSLGAGALAEALLPRIRSTLAGPIPEAPADEEVEGVIPEAIRVPLDELDADAGYMFGRVAADGSTAGMMAATMRGKLSAIRTALRSRSTETDKADPATGGEVETLHFTADWLVRGMPVKAPGSNKRGRIASEVTFDGKVYVDYPAGGGAYWPATDLQPWESHRDVLGRLVRDAWVKWARSQPNPKASWLVPYDDLPEADKEADRQIGEALTTAFPPVLTAALRRDEGKGVREALDNSNSLFAAILHEPRPHGEIETQIAENRAAIRALSASPLTEEQSAALQDVVAERKRQVQAEGWTPEHDDGYANGEMACAAGVYALSAGSRDYRWVLKGLPCNDYLEAAMKLWPWDWAWWKPTNRRRDLVKAGALIIAEIERLDRLPRSTTGGAK